MRAGCRSSHPLLGIDQKNGDSFLPSHYRLAEAGKGIAPAAARDNARARRSVGHPALQKTLHTCAQSGLSLIVIAAALHIDRHDTHGLAPSSPCRHKWPSV